ncbi:Major tail tube protein FII [Escherichia coli]|uniref:Major tail tube protein FII n=1 Tax=Escherichia coli TaxID=562 RepID=A0A376P9I8_ECOLX|nr:Major tail tube protein FII [Escherichia coli]
MAVPKNLRFFTLFVDGENEVGKVTSVTLPKLTRKTDSYRGGGMMGAVSMISAWTTPRLMRALSWGAQFVSCS